MNKNDTLPKLLFFDFDNTLVDSKTHHIPESASKALNTLGENGYHIAIASGRSYLNLKETGACDDYPWIGFCLNNGQMVMDGQQKIVHHHFLPHDGIVQAIAHAKEKGFNLFFSSPEGDFLMEEPNPYVFEAHDFFREPIPEVKTYHHQAIDKILVYAPIGYDYAEFKAIKGLGTFISVSTYADLAKEGISKHSAILELCQHLNLEPEYAAFGDSQNDIEMLMGAKIAVAMGNSDPRLKTVAHVVAPNIDDDGIMRILIDLGYIQ